MEDKKAIENHLKIVPVKNTVLFPHNILPIMGGKEWTNESVEKAARLGETVGVLAYKSDNADNPYEDLHLVGTEAKVLRVIRFPDNSCGALVQGLRRFRILNYTSFDPGNLTAEVQYFLDDPIAAQREEIGIEIVALGRAMKLLVQKAIGLSPHVPQEASIFIENVQDSDYLADLVVPYLSIEFRDKQALLEMEDLETRLRRVHYLLTREIDVLEISKKINTDVKTELGKQQRKYFVREQMKLLQKELGELDGRQKSSSSADPSELQERITSSKMTAEVRTVAVREVERMGMMQPGAPEYMVIHSYVNWLLDIPWEVYTQGEVNLKNAENILNLDHHGLKKVKKRVLEFLAVCVLKKSLKGSIILFVGPPGVGKTSLGKSIAKALGRKFIRIALGGVRDEAEIRGHRRTYIGSMPGKIADALKKAGSMDPVILFDEIDKLASDGRGDPSSALLEVLDPEQNNTFTDHYLNVPLDLSKIFFIATANSLHSIPAPLRDRMEVIELNSYTLDEKSKIAFQHLLPQVTEEHGLKDILHIQLEEDTMKNLIQQYTREAGVRQLKRELAGVVRCLAREYVESEMEKKEKGIAVPKPKK